MILTIARKEFLANLMTLRFSYALAFCIVLMGLIAYVLTEDYTKRLDAYRAELIKEEQELKKVKVYAQLEISTARPPSPLSIFSEGMEKRLGNILRFSHAKVPTMLTWRKETNPLLDAFPPFDLATIAQLLFSLMALFFAYDAICGERETGTLPLIGSNAVARYQMLIGKWIGGMLCTILPVLTGFLVALILIERAPQISLSGSEWFRVALTVGTTLVYISVFYLIGLCISVRVGHSATALVFAIFVWALTTIVLPTTTAYLVGELMPLPSERELMHERHRLSRELSEKFHTSLAKAIQGKETSKEIGDEIELPAIHEMGLEQSFWKASLGPFVAVGGLFREAAPILKEFYGKMEPRRIAYGEQMLRLEDRLVAGRTAQAERSRRIGRLFLAPAFSGAVSAFAGTDLASYQDFIQHARGYRQVLIGFMRDRGIFTSTLFFSQDREEDLLRAKDAMRLLRAGQLQYTSIAEWDPLDLSDLPKFPEYRSTAAGHLARAGLDLAVLSLANAVFMLLALTWFLRRDLT